MTLFLTHLLAKRTKYEMFGEVKGRTASRIFRTWSISSSKYVGFAESPLFVKNNKLDC